ncbi:MAG: sodium:glutamate symporter [Candidatus Methanomethylophilaceae archaeon]|nr:sodium:glutamate symporter [Candidatus Methanomethylophilaceae archaeon]
MRVFFCSVGFTASAAMLRSGGRTVLVMAALMLVLVVSQNLIGVVYAGSFGLDPMYGLALGSVSLSGGHGTAAAYGDLLVDTYGLDGADTVAIASATFGLAIAGVIGGPLARSLVRRHSLHPSEGYVTEGVETELRSDGQRFLTALLYLILCIGAGTVVNMAVESVGVTIPSYLGAMLVAIVVRNVVDRRHTDVPLKEIDVIGWVSLCMFLVLALMSIKLWQIADLAAVMIVVLALQTLFLALFSYFAVFRATGRSYDSAALVAGTMGFGMGATPNAVANVEAVTSEFGPAPVAGFTVPVIGGAVLDVLNTGVLLVFLNVL